jgi:hypothetical protein
VDDVKVYEEDGVLKVKGATGFNLFKDDNQRIGVVVTMPTLQAVSLSGANKARIEGFKGLSKLNVDLTGASKTDIDVETNELTVELTGASKATLRGSATTANFDLTGACKLTSTGMNIQNAEVTATGASKAKLGHIEHLSKNATGVSKIESQE